MRVFVSQYLKVSEINEYFLEFNKKNLRKINIFNNTFRRNKRIATHNQESLKFYLFFIWKSDLSTGKAHPNRNLHYEVCPKAMHSLRNSLGLQVSQLK